MVRHLTRASVARWRQRADGALVVGALGVVWWCALPLLISNLALLDGDGWSTLQSTLGQARLWLLLGRSLLHSLAVTAVATAMGVSLGVALEKTDIIGRRVGLWLHLLPLFLPPFLVAFGWFHVFGRGGWFHSLWTSRMLFSQWGMLLTLALVLTPVVTALSVLGLRGVDPSLEDAARCVAPPWRVVTGITLPLILPAISLGAIIVFALTLSEVGVPMFLRVRSYGGAVFARLGGIDDVPGEAVALVLPLLLVGVLLVLVEQRVLAGRSFESFGLRARQLTPVQLGRYRGAISAAVWLLLLAPLSPLVALAAAAGVGGLWQASGWLGTSLQSSLLAGVVAATLISGLGIIVGHALARRRAGARVLDAVALLAFVVPSSAMGVGLIDLYNRPYGQFVYASMAIVVLGLVARYAVIGVRTAAVVIVQSSPHKEEAAAVFGAGYARRLLRLVIPMHARGLLGGWLIALVFCLRDLDTVVMLHPAGMQPLTVRIFTLEANGPPQLVAGLSLLHIIITALLLGVGGRLIVRRGRAGGGRHRGQP